MLRKNRIATAVTLLCLLTMFLYNAQAQITQLRVAYSTWSPDGRFIALINSERVSDSIEIFTADLMPLVTLSIDMLSPEVRGYGLNHIAWNHDGTALAAAVIANGPDPLVLSYIAVWNTDDWTLRFAMPYFASEISWSPNGDYLGAGAFILDAMTGVLVSQLGVSDPSSVRFVVWNLTNERQYVVGFDSNLDVFDPFTSERLARFPYIGAVKPDFSPDGHYLAFVNRDAKTRFIIDIVNATTYQQVASIQPEATLLEPYALNWLTNDQLALIMFDMPLTIVNPFTTEVVDTVSYITTTWSPEGTQFFDTINLPATVGGGRGIALYDRETEAVIAQYSLISTVQSLALVDIESDVNTPLLASEELINTVSIHTANDAIIQAFTYPETVGSVVFEVDGVRTIDNSAPYTIPLPPAGMYTISAVPHSAADGQGEAGLSFTAMIQIVSETPTLVPMETPLLSPTAAPIILDVAWSPEGEMIATVDNSGKLEITFADQASTVFEFTRTVAELVKAAVSWSPLGDRLAAGIGNRMYVWDATSWQLLYDYEVGAPSGFFFASDLGDNNPEGVQNITWSVDERYMVVGTYSYEISVWDMQEEELIFRDFGISGGGPGGVWLGDGWLGDGFGKLNIFSGEEIFPTVEDIRNRFGGSIVTSTEPRPDNTQMAWGSIFGYLVIYDPNTLRGITAIEVTDSIPPAPRRSIADISWDGTWNFIAVVSHDGELYIANLLTKEVETVLNIDGRLNAVDWNPVGNEIVYAGISSTGEPILEIVDVTGIAGVAPIPAVPLTESDDVDINALEAQPTAYVSWSPDGQYIATAAADKVTVFRVADQQVVNESLINRVTLTVPIWSSDSQNLAFSNGVDFEIWSNVDSTPVLEHLYTNAGGSKAAAWSKNGELLALSNGEFVDFWDVPSDTLAQRYLNEGIGSAWSLDWNDDHKRVLIAGALGVKVLDIETETSLLYFSLEPYVNTQGEYVNPTALSAVWSPSQDRIAIASDDAVRVVSASPSQDSGMILFPYDSNVFIGHVGYVYSVAWHPNGDFLASSGEDGTVRIWDVETREQIQLINAGEAAVRSVAWSPDGTQLAYGGVNDTIIILTPDLPTISTPSPTATLTDIKRVTSMAWNSDGTVLAVSGILNDQPGVWFYDAASELIGSEITSLFMDRRLAWSPDDTMIAGYSSNETARTVNIFSVGDGSIVSQFDVGIVTMPILWSPDSNFIMIGKLDSVILYNVIDDSIVREMNIPSYFPRNGGISSIAWDTDNDRVYGTYSIKDLLVWNSTTAELITAVKFPTTIDSPIALNAVGGILAVQGPDGQVWLVDPMTLDTVSTLQAPSDKTIRDIVWYEDNIHLATFSFDDTIRVWNTVTDAIVETIIVGERISDTLTWRPGTNELTYSPVNASPVTVEIEAVSMPSSATTPISSATATP